MGGGVWTPTGVVVGGKREVGGVCSEGDSSAKGGVSRWIRGGKREKKRCVGAGGVYRGEAECGGRGRGSCGLFISRAGGRGGGEMGAGSWEQGSGARQRGARGVVEVVEGWLRGVGHLFSRRRGGGGVVVGSGDFFARIVGRAVIYQPAHLAGGLSSKMRQRGMGGGGFVRSRASSVRGGGGGVVGGVGLAVWGGGGERGGMFLCPQTGGGVEGRGGGRGEGSGACASHRAVEVGGYGERYVGAPACTWSGLWVGRARRGRGRRWSRGMSRSRVWGAVRKYR